MTRAVVFGYHNVGVRCLKVLLAHGVDVPLVVTHDDSPGETIWFGSVAHTAADYGIRTIAPEDPNATDVIASVGAGRPDFIFSFYYRRMLAPALLALAPLGALNMHGSLLPKYRGRAPVNWAIIHGETETGATLHYMADKPDNGDIVAQTGVPILPDDVAGDVFAKVTVAAEMTLDRALPGLLAGTAPRMRQDPGKASYFGGRKPEDGVIDWAQSSIAIHNLVRAVAPPYPGARTLIDGHPARLLRTRVLDTTAPAGIAPAFDVADGRITVRCGGGGILQVLELEIDDAIVGPAAFAHWRAAHAPADPGRIGAQEPAAPPDRND
ncbi:MAG TPA: formyltransferase [Casimicrobiaceae bacterium]|jgi:methionyl-tRNA formyltransferase|nr:formyltransferase [Casimicrobiaceae bacterium]